MAEPTRALTPGLQRFQSAVHLVLRVLAGARQLAVAAAEKEALGLTAEAAALWRRALNFGMVEEPCCECTKHGDPHRPRFHVMPVRVCRLLWHRMRTDLCPL